MQSSAVGEVSGKGGKLSVCPGWSQYSPFSTDRGIDCYPVTGYKSAGWCADRGEIHRNPGMEPQAESTHQKKSFQAGQTQGTIYS